MAKGVTVKWDYDIRGRMVLAVHKNRGKLTLSEIEEALRYENRGEFNGHYAILLNCSEATCGGSGWGDEVEPKGDDVFLYPLEDGSDCPVCANLTPPFDYCPNCGEPWKQKTE